MKRWTARRELAAVAVAVVVGAALAVGAGDVEAAPPRDEAVLSVSPSSGVPGASVLVTGAQWPPATQVSLQLCGAGAIRGSSDCDMASSVILGTSSTGTFGGQLAVSLPPAPCPCVVQVSAIERSVRRTLPFDIVGAPSAPLPTKPSGVPRRSVEIVSTHVDGTSWQSWFGWSARRTLVLEYRNVSNRVVKQPSVIVTTGRRGREHSPIRVAHQPALLPFQVRTIRVPVTIDAPTFGEYGVRVAVGEPGALDERSIETSSWPWGWFVIGLLLVQLVLLLLRNRARRRLAHQEVLAQLDALDSPEAPGAVAATVAGPPAVRETATAPGSPAEARVPEAAAAVGARAPDPTAPISWRPSSGPPDGAGRASTPGPATGATSPRASRPT